MISLQCCRFSTDKKDTQESLSSSTSGATKKDQDLDSTKGKGVKKVCMEGQKSLIPLTALFEFSGGDDMNHCD